ncbi:MAG: tetratricopeptide repeat protein, partial [Bacteroidia bacterium]|nr:tetratricopeptide repeat protein [Bacteroidia bacterium]
MKRFFILIVLSLPFFSQNQRKIDSLLNLLSPSLHDSIRFKAYMILGYEFQNSNPDTAIYFHKLAEKTAEKIPGPEGELRKGEAMQAKGWDYYVKSDFASALMHNESSLRIAEKHSNSSNKRIKTHAQKLLACVWCNIGGVYRIQDNNAKALEYYFRALKICEEIGYKQGQASNLGNIGIVFRQQSDYPKALEYLFHALKIHEEIGDKPGQAISLGNIGTVYHEQGDYPKALEYYFRALKINEEIGNKKGQANNLGNIGAGYKEQGDYPKALDYFFRALKMDEELGNRNGVARHLGNIGIMYHGQGDSASRSGNAHLAADRYAKALEYYFRALKICEEIGYKQGQAFNLENIGALYLKQKKYTTAEAYLKKAEKLNKEFGTIYYLQFNYLDLSDLYYQNGRYKQAYDYYKEYIKYRDSVMSEENQKALVQKEMRFNFEKEQALKEKEHQKKLEMERKEKEKQRIITWFVAAGLILVVAFLGFVINRLNVTRKQKNIIEKQKQIVEEQKLVVEEQKKLVEQKNKDILDSINYAKRIQNAILPSNVKWKEHLPESFVLYLPKDIVAGDFYWMEYANNCVYVAAADCTGHGVPGAMVSVVCSNALTKAVLEEKLTQSDQILNRTRELVIEKLTSEDNIRDGMDICLVRIEKGKNIIQFSGANRPLYLVNQDKSLTEI